MNCDSPFYVLPKAATEKVPVPCGRCPPCKLRRVNGWVFRMLEEEKISSSSHFVTITYDTTHVPISKNGFMTLDKRDFQLFMKRLRKLCPDASLKYYAVGEYGTNNKRPHYHAIIFNCPNPQLFSDAWERGAVHVGTVSGDSIAYTMKYIDKLSGKPSHARDDRQPEFPLMSKGLGKNYLTPEMVDYHKADISRLYATREGGHRIALPRYYRGKIYSEDEQKQQMRYVAQVVGVTERRERLEFHRLYDELQGYTFEQWKESKRYGRYKKFYHSQKNRDL